MFIFESMSQALLMGKLKKKFLDLKFGSQARNRRNNKEKKFAAKVNLQGHVDILLVFIAHKRSLTAIRYLKILFSKSN